MLVVSDGKIIWLLPLLALFAVPLIAGAAEPTTRSLTELVLTNQSEAEQAYKGSRFSRRRD